MKYYSPIPKDELTRLIELSEQMVFLNCRYMLRDGEEAKDMAQEVYLTVFTKLSTLKRPEAFFDWVKIIKINKCKNRLKKANPYFLLENASGEEEELDPYALFADQRDQTSPDKSLDTKETKELLLEHIGRLPDAQRLCVILFYYDDLSLKEIAQLMEISVGTVKSRLAYARLRLKKSLEAEKRRGSTLYGRTPAAFLAYIAYFLKKQFQDQQDDALLRSILTDSLAAVEAAGGSGVGAAGMAAGAALEAGVAESAYAFVTGSLSLKGLTLGALWATTAGKAVISTVVGMALIWSVAGGIRLGMGDNNTREVQNPGETRVEIQAVDFPEETSALEESGEASEMQSGESQPQGAQG